MFELLQRIKLLRRVQYCSPDSAILFGGSTRIHSKAGSRIILNGKLTLGIPLSGFEPGFAHKKNTILYLGKNATLIIDDNVSIAPGATIRVSDDATLHFSGKNVIAHDSIILANKEIKIGKNTSISWNCVLIDDDGHSFYRTDGKRIKKLRKKMHIGDNVGIQMNVTIPVGCRIGNNSIISACTVVRSDLQENTLTYTTNLIKTLPNYTTGFQFE